MVRRMRRASLTGTPPFSFVCVIIPNHVLDLKAKPYVQAAIHPCARLRGLCYNKAYYQINGVLL
jgi:hypothetical protein